MDVIVPATPTGTGTALTGAVGELDPVKLASPTYRAVIWCPPEAVYVTVQVARLFVTGRPAQGPIG